LSPVSDATSGAQALPTYDYQCQKCGFEFERDQRITEDPIKTCPECKSRKAKRLLSAPNFILKGGGWYADGYGSSGGAKSDGDASTDSSSNSSSDSSSKTDSSKTDTSKSSSTDSSSEKKASKGKKKPGKSAA
jgi:putative FmdB family regulatory protein